MGEGRIRIGKAGLVVRRLSFSFFITNSESFWVIT